MTLYTPPKGSENMLRDLLSKRRKQKMQQPTVNRSVCDSCDLSACGDRGHVSVCNKQVVPIHTTPHPREMPMFFEGDNICKSCSSSDTCGMQSTSKTRCCFYNREHDCV
jgi:hypothetical protein